ncbi:hypothetical protein Tco_0304286 [Tanacetum coccineum]
MIASSESRNSSKNMPRFSSNDMVHNHYIEEAKKKTQKSGRNSKPSVMPSARSESTANGSKPKPRINNQKSRNWPASKSSCITTKTVPIIEHSKNSRNFSDSKHFVCSSCQKYVFNANHDSCVIKFLNEVNSCAKIEKHSISLEIALQECQVQLKNDTVCKEKASNVFRKEREQYVEIQDLKAQLQDKNMAISLRFESLREGFPSRWESVGFCPIDASIRGWQRLPSGFKKSRSLKIPLTWWIYLKCHGGNCEGRQRTQKGAKKRLGLKGLCNKQNKVILRYKKLRESIDLLSVETLLDSWKDAPGDDTKCYAELVVVLLLIFKEELRIFLDELIDKVMIGRDCNSDRLEILGKLQQVNKAQASEVAQKAKIKWYVEGDENTKFFHGMLNKKPLAK